MQLKDQYGNVVVDITVHSKGAGPFDAVIVTMHADDGSKPTISFVKDAFGSLYLGFYRDAERTKVGCDLAVIFDEKEGPSLQVVRGEEVQRTNLFDLVKRANEVLGKPA